MRVPFSAATAPCTETARVSLTKAGHSLLAWVSQPYEDSGDEMSTEDTGNGEDGRPDAARQESGGIPGSENGAGLGATGEPNTFEPEEVPEDTDSSAAGETSVATAEDTPDVANTPVETSEPS
jgi:hypothetical protein